MSSHIDVIRITFTALVSVTIGVATPHPSLAKDGITDIPRNLNSTKDMAPSIVAVELNGKLISSGTPIMRDSDTTLIISSLLEENDLVIPDQAKGLYPDGYVAIEDLMFLDYSINENNLVLKLMASARAFSQKRITATHHSTPKAMSNMAALYGNYNTTVIATKNGVSANASLDFAATLEKSTLSNQFLLRDLTGDFKATRLDTLWTRDFPANRTRLTIGDTVATRANNSNLGSTFRFGGIQWGTRFELQPGKTTYPLPSIYAEPATQSTVDLFINESLRFRTEAQPGPLTITSPAVTNGAGQIQVVLKDITGREQVFTQPFYASTRLLAPGLVDYEINAGALRENFGKNSTDYGEKFIAARYRRGISNRLTAQVLTEVAESSKVLGVSMLTTVPQIGLGSFSAQSSQTNTDKGNSLAFSLERQSENFGFGLRHRRFSSGYRQLTTPQNGRRIETDLAASIRYSIASGSSISAVYSDRIFNDQTNSKILSVAYSQRIMRNTILSLSGSLIKGKDRPDNSITLERFDRSNVTLSLFHSFGTRQSISGSIKYKRESANLTQRERSTTVTLRRSAPRDLGYGYRVRLDRNENSEEQISGTLDVNTPVSLFSIRGQARKNNSSLTANLRGSVVAAKRSIFLQRPIQSGFALVNVGGNSGVGIYRGSKLTAYSNKQGYAIVTGLTPYIENTIRIDTTDLPFRANIRSDRFEVVPRYLGGVEADFKVTDNHPALITLQLPSGAPVPIGAIVLARDSKQQFRVAFNGQVYLTGQNKIRYYDVYFEGKSCLISINTSETSLQNAFIYDQPVTCHLK